MPFDPQITKYPYPQETNKHYLSVKKDDGTVFDSKYPYIDTSKSFEFKRNLTRIALVLVAFPVCAIRMGLRVKGKENLKKHKDILKNGVISVSNHVHMWDYIGVMSAVFPHKPDILAWAKNIRGENGKVIRLTGGIPVPEGNPKATLAYVKSVKKYLGDGGWLHICAEGSMWEYYRPIRPFLPGTAYFAVKTGKPVVPLAYSYRKPSFIRKLFGQPACLTLNIGEPVFPAESMNAEDPVTDMTKRIHEAVCRLAGYGPSENLYEPIFDNSKRIDYYTTEYGVGYKGSR